MYFVEIVSKDETLDMDGCIQFRISDSGIVSADFVDGSARIYRMREGDEVIRTPMSDEDIHFHPELGPCIVIRLPRQKLRQLLKPL